MSKDFFRVAGLIFLAVFLLAPFLAYSQARSPLERRISVGFI